MTLSAALRLDRLSLKNFRCFTECEVDLHPQLTVLVAENGLGKTAILDGIAVAIGLFVDTLLSHRPAYGFQRSDVHLARGENDAMTPAPMVELWAAGTIGGQRIEWSRALSSKSERARTTTAKAKALEDAALMLGTQLKDFTNGNRSNLPAVPLPLVAFYGTRRLWREHQLAESKRFSHPRLEAYLDCLSSLSPFERIETWYGEKVDAARKRTEVAYGPHEKPQRQLAAVREATRTMLAPSQWQEIDWDAERGTIVVRHPVHGQLPLKMLSDGVQNMITLAADLARRCVQLNPHFGENAASLTQGIVLIDEVDMHLHPRWQQLVLDLLQRTFPLVQMIVTTHSPHVLSTVDKDSIRIVRLQDGKGILETPAFQTRGVESADVLSAIMGVDPVPLVAEAQWLNRYRGFIEDGKAETAEAQALRSQLVTHFGASHPVMIDCDRLLRFQAFKLRRSTPQGRES